MRQQQQRHVGPDRDRHEVLLDIVRRAPGGLQRRGGGGEGDVVEQKRVAVGGGLCDLVSAERSAGSPPFSTTTLWLKPSDMRCANSRASMSVVAPAGNGTMIRMFRAGNRSWLRTGVGSSPPASAVTQMSSRRVFPCRHGPRWADHADLALSLLMAASLDPRAAQSSLGPGFDASEAPTHTTIITGFSINALNASSRTAPSAPSTAR